MNKGDIAFVQGRGIISKCIRLVDKGDFSHVAICINDRDVIEADAFTDIRTRELNNKSYNKVEIIDLGLDDAQRTRIVDKSMRYIGTKYDYVQLLWYLIRGLFKLKGKNKLNNPNNMICSELVYIVLEESGTLDELGIRGSIRNGSDLTPNELYDLVKYASLRR